VDVAGINYDLTRQLAPDPDQTIALSQLAPAANADLLPPVSVRLRAGPIRDRNGNPVPDGTPVTFYAEYGSGAYVLPVSAATAGGLAETTLTLSEAGLVRFRAESGEARRSQTVDLTISSPPTQTPVPSLTPSATPTDAPTPTSTASPSPTPSPTPTGEMPAPTAGFVRPVDGTDLLLAAGATILVGAGGCLLLGKRRRRRVLVRWILLATIGGMVAYILYAGELIRPDAWGILPQGAWAARAAMIGMVAVGAVLPLVAVRTTDAQGEQGS
jgi:hypothetical protein